MTNIKEIQNKQDMQLHIDKAFEIIDAHLPEYYVAKILEKLKGYSRGTIRNVRSRQSKITQNNFSIITALVELALENKEKKEKLLELIN